jgi:hypothetical protein
MLAWSRWLRLAAGSTACLLAAALAPRVAAEEFAHQFASADARNAVSWIQRSGDAQGRPFAVVDKRGARIYVFEADGQLAGESTALLGSTFGDHTVPGVGAQAQTGYVGPDDRTTPAGRFEATPGVNLSGEHIIWVDYDSAFAIHRLRPGSSYKVRASSLASLDAGKRLSWGCVVVPVAFYEQVVQRVLGSGRSVVYVLPETRPVEGFVRTLEHR